MLNDHSLAGVYRREFSNYTKKKFIQDFFAGCTVAAVALPLALAFGVASGSTAAAGLVTAIAAGLIMGVLSGAPYQISGPTGAMSAILILLAQQYGPQGIWIAGFLAGVFLLIIGLLRLGRFIAFVPAPVITGFTSGIAVIIAVGQFDNFFGIKSVATTTAVQKLVWYFSAFPNPNYSALSIGVLVMAVMIFWPKKWNAKVPSSLVGIVLATVISSLLALPVDTIGAIPKSIFLEERFFLTDMPWTNLSDFLAPALVIAALGAVESLLCGAVGGNMTGVRLRANQELVAQGVGNMLIPFLGGVPATAAVARSSVGINSGGQSRLVSIIHALILLVSMFVLANVISKVPMAALAGVLMVTAWRMNEWSSMHFYFSKCFKTGIVTLLITLIATITLDLTQAILVGSLLSALIFLNQVSDIEIVVEKVDANRLIQKGIEVTHDCSNTRVAYMYGPLFFAATGHFEEAFADLSGIKYLVLSVRGMPIIDASGLRVVESLNSRLTAKGGALLLSGLNPKVKAMLQRGGILDLIGEEHIFWSADQAIVYVSKL